MQLGDAVGVELGVAAGRRSLNHGRGGGAHEHGGEGGDGSSGDCDERGGWQKVLSEGRDEEEDERGGAGVVVRCA